MATPQQSAPEAPDTSEGPEKTVYVLHGQELASRSRRLGALAIDSAIIGLIVLMLFVGAVAGDDSGIPPESAALLTVAFLVFYHILMWTAFSATPGKMMLKLQIVDRNGWRIGIVQSIGRLFGYGISTLFIGLGFVWVFVDRLGRGWHDVIAGTYVVYLGSERSKSRNMAGDFYKDLMGGPPIKRDFASQASAEAVDGALAADDAQQATTRVRVVDVDDAKQARADQPAIGDYPVADFSRRLRAFGLDAVASLVVSIAALFVFSIWIPRTPDSSTAADSSRQDAIILSVILALICGYLIYPIASNWLFKSTPGKHIMNLQVVDANGGNVVLLRLALRNLSYVVSAAPIFLGFISALSDENSQAWHDKIAGTYVTYRGGGRLSDQAKASQARRGLSKDSGRSHWPTE